MNKVFGITYGDHTTEWIEYRARRTATPWRFENDHMIDIARNHLGDVGDSDFVGVLSWKFYKKTGINKARLEWEMAHSTEDVINCSRWPGRLHFMDWSDQGHKGIKDMIRRCCEHCGLEYDNDPKHVIFANQFVARKRIYCDYIERVIAPSLELLEGPMWPEVNEESGYTAGMEMDVLEALTGLTFYNYVPFILERMFMQFAKGLKIKDL